MFQKQVSQGLCVENDWLKTCCIFLIACLKEMPPLRWRKMLTDIFSENYRPLSTKYFMPGGHPLPFCLVWVVCLLTFQLDDRGDIKSIVNVFSWITFPFARVNAINLKTLLSKFGYFVTDRNGLFKTNMRSVWYSNPAATLINGI